MIFGSIDGGKAGGIVFLAEDGKILEMYPTPVIKGSKVKDEYDIPAIDKILRSYVGKPIHVILEKGQPLPSALGGSSANFGRGFSFGLYQALLVSNNIPYTVVAPRTWQKVMFLGVNAEDTKTASVMVAKRLWPQQDWRRTEKSKKDHDGFTDACLMAMWGIRTMGNNNLA